MEYSTCSHINRDLVKHFFTCQQQFKQQLQVNQQKQCQLIGLNQSNSSFLIPNYQTQQQYLNFQLEQAQLTQQLLELHHWSCCVCFQLFNSVQTRLQHFQETNHSLFIYSRESRNELYCSLCNDFQYDQLFDSLSTPLTTSKQTIINRVVGMVNMGSTCFLSSVLQVLLFNPILVRFFELSDLFIGSCQLQQSTPPQLCLFCEIYKLFKIVNKFTW